MVTERSAVAVTAVVSVAVLSVGSGSVADPGTVTLAVLLSVPRKNGSIVPVTAIVTEPPAATSTVVFGLPLPDGAEQADGRSATHVQVALVNPPGNTSATLTPATDDGPALDTTIV